MATKVGFVGLGTMGTPMATNAVNAGFDVMVYDVDEKAVAELTGRAAKGARSGQEVGEHAEVVQFAVPDDQQILAAVLGAHGVLAGAKPGTTLLIHSTIMPRTVLTIAERAEKKGVHVLDCQMTGANRGARTQSLLFMVGGDAEVLERCRPVLAASGKHVIHMGPLGMGAVTKAAQQAITVVNLMAATEGIHLAQKAGVDLDAFYQVLSLSTAQSRVADERMAFPPEIGGEPRRPGGDPRPFHRGLRAVLGLAFSLDVPMPATALAQQMVPWALNPVELPTEPAQSQPPQA